VVRDLILVDSIITGESAAVEPVRLKGLRLGVPRSFFYEDLDSELSPVVESALAKLRDAGCILVEADIPDIEKLSAISGRLSYFECMADLARYLKDSGIPLTAREVVAKIASPDVKKVYEESVFGPKAPTAESYQHALTVERPALQAAYREYFRTQDVAAIVFPTTILPARPIGDDTDVELNGKRLPTLLTFTHNARPVTSAGLPGLSIPIGQTASGLPVGLEFDGPEGADRSLLGMGLSAEKVFGRLRAPAV
jgi:mandelamide amidase